MLRRPYYNVFKTVRYQHAACLCELVTNCKRSCVELWLKSIYLEQFWQIIASEKFLRIFFLKLKFFLFINEDVKKITNHDKTILLLIQSISTRSKWKLTLLQAHYSYASNSSVILMGWYQPTVILSWDKTFHIFQLFHKKN